LARLSTHQSRPLFLASATAVRRLRPPCLFTNAPVIGMFTIWRGTPGEFIGILLWCPPTRRASFSSCPGSPCGVLRYAWARGGEYFDIGHSNAATPPPCYPVASVCVAVGRTRLRRVWFLAAGRWFTEMSTTTARPSGASLVGAFTSPTMVTNASHVKCSGCDADPDNSTAWYRLDVNDKVANWATNVRHRVAVARICCKCYNVLSSNVRGTTARPREHRRDRCL
jgi:hypothetical protein